MPTAPANARARRSRVRLTRSERREQLIDVARALFAERGLEGTSVEEIAAHAGVSKPVVYEHFGGKEGLYAVVVDREVRTLHDAIRTAITTPRANPRALIELGTLALLDYIDDNPNGFRILSRDSSATSPEGSFATILSDIASRVEDLLADEFTKRSSIRRPPRCTPRCWSAWSPSPASGGWTPARSRASPSRSSRPTW